MLMYHSGLICLTWGMATTATSPAFSAFWESIEITLALGYIPKHVLKYYHILAWLRVKCSPMYFKDFHRTFCFVLCVLLVWPLGMTLELLLRIFPLRDALAPFLKHEEEQQSSEIRVSPFHYVLCAATSPAVKLQDETLTYLNQGHVNLLIFLCLFNLSQHLMLHSKH